MALHSQSLELLATCHGWPDPLQHPIIGLTLTLACLCILESAQQHLPRRLAQHLPAGALSWVAADVATDEGRAQVVRAAAEAVAHNIKGALAIPHPYGRLQFGADLDLHFRTLIGAGCNPNVAAVVVIDED